MLMDRIIGAFTFRKGVYAEVERDSSFTTTAWAIVAVVAVLNQISGYFAARSGAAAAADFLAETDLGIDLAISPFSIVSGTIVAIAAFAVGCFVVNWVGKSMFKAEVTFEEVVRTMGLANVWGLVGVVAGLLGLVAPVLLCAASPLVLAGTVLGIAASAIAVKEALDLEWGQTIVTVIVAWVAIFFVNLVIGGILGVGGAVMSGLGL